jgi:hypothetical protein
LALAVAFLVHALEAQDARTEHVEALHARHDRLVRQAEHLNLTSTAMRAGRDAHSAKDTALVAAQALLQREAAYAWPQLFVAVERASGATSSPGKSRIALTAFSHQIDGAGRATVSIEGLCMEPGDALAFADALGADPAFEEAFVAFHDALPLPEGEWKQQFRIDAYPSEALATHGGSPPNAVTSTAGSAS